MDPRSLKEVRSWCEATGFHPSRAMGQNFLVDKEALDRIAATAEAKPGDNILEVGPGLGALTLSLLETGANITAIEKDVRLYERMHSDPDFATLKSLICDNAVKTDWTSVFSREHFSAFASNLPYSVGTRILLDIASCPNAPDTLVVLVQKEVADRFSAKEGEKDRGQAGVWLQLDYDVRQCFDIPPASFWPRPEVTSTVVRLDRHPCLLTPAKRPLFYNLVKFCFMHRRKQLGGLLRKSSLFPTALTALEQTGIPAKSRPEELSLDKWIALVEAM